MFFKHGYQKTLKNCGRIVSLEELQAAINISKVSLLFIKISNSLRQVLQTYSEIRIFCVPQKSPPEAIDEDLSQGAREILW